MLNAKKVQIPKNIISYSSAIQLTSNFGNEQYFGIYSLLFIWICDPRWVGLETWYPHIPPAQSVAKVFASRTLTFTKRELMHSTESFYERFLQLCSNII